MSFAILLLTAAQSVNVNRNLEALKVVEARTEAVMNRVFVCMDDQVKAHMRQADILQATPDSIVDGALKACSFLKRQYESAETAPDAFITADKAHELTETAFGDIRKAYAGHISDVMAKPEFAEARSNLAIAAWRKCVTEKAAEWSRLKDEASIVGQAAVTECESVWPMVQGTLGLYYQSKGLPTSGASDSSEKLHGTMREVATATVIRERAKRLRKQ